jgi:hypothetical protein
MLPGREAAPRTDCPEFRRAFVFIIGFEADRVLFSVRH